MIDIHCHILPGMDDGAVNLEESMIMANLAVKAGITTIIATPHHKNGKNENRKKEILAHTVALNQALQSKNIPLTILPGQEPRIHRDLLLKYQQDEILSLNNNGKYILIELPPNYVPSYTEQLLFEVQINGLTPVIVHPERNQVIQKYPNLLYEFVRRGACAQVTTASLIGRFGKKIKKITLDLIDANLVHFIASDAHNISYRTYWMKEAYEEIETHFGPDFVAMFKNNSEILVEGKAIYKEPPTRLRQKKWIFQIL